MVTMIFSFGVNISVSKVTGKDGNEYKTVKIGTQEWTSENLNVEHYRNGDPIPQVQDEDKWSNLKTGAWCYYENKTSNGITYGKHYNWYTISNIFGELAPEGWHVPSDAEWTRLTDFMGGKKLAGDKLKATTLWATPNTGATNESGFTALPGGYRNFLGNNCDGVGKSGHFWSELDIDDVEAWGRDLSCASSGVHRDWCDKKYGFSIRCMKD
jgi:uncharacterized protein (TIGR02145 family)